MTQKFHKGDRVKVADDLGPSMSHFTAGVEAIVIGSYSDQYGGGNTNSYTLHLKGSGQCSWYYESQLTLIERDRLDLLKQWKDDQEAEAKLKSDRGWIFDNGPEVLNSAHGATIEALGRDLGVTNLWGPHGEGFAWYSNALAILGVARPYLESKDKAGWMDFCRRHTADQVNS